MTPDSPSLPSATTGPPTKHQLALMIWLAVFPTLTILNLSLGDWLRTLTPVLRTFVLATVAVPIVIYGLMPQFHRIHGHLLTARATADAPSGAPHARVGSWTSPQLSPHVVMTGHHIEGHRPDRG
jgi:hypothetical protein